MVPPRTPAFRGRHKGGGGRWIRTVGSSPAKSSPDLCHKTSHGSFLTRCWRDMDSNLYGAFRVKWLFLVCCSSLFGAGKAVLRPVACDQAPGARGRGQGTETLAQLSGLPLSVACVSQRLDA